MNNLKRYYFNFLKYNSLVFKLTIKDLKVKYKRSILGFAWSLLNPLLNMIVLSIVFKHLFRFSVENFSAYLICGQTLFNFFSEATSLSLGSIYRDGQLIKKVYLPKYVFPLSKVLFSLVNMLISTIAIVFVCFVTGVNLKISMVFSIFPIIYLAVFCSGFGMILASVGTFFRDLEHIYSIFITIWMYMTPVIYPVTIIPVKYMPLILSNPLYYYIEYFRQTIINGNIPNINMNVICIVYSFSMFFLGVLIFYKSQDRFIFSI